MTKEPAQIKGFELLQGVAARALDDDEFRQRLLDDPKSVLRESGLTVADELELVVHENSPDRIHLVLPSRPEAWDELEFEEVDLAVLMPRSPF